jgi:cbb3-type cytochrome oxidase maturation protein
MDEGADMDILYLLIPLSVVLVFVIGVFFWWSLRNGQYDDLEGPGHRILMDDDRASINTGNDSSSQLPDNRLGKTSAK